MAPKRASTPTSSDPSASSKRPKLESDTSPTVTTIPLDWLQFTPPAELQSLLLACCAASPEISALVSASLTKSAPLFSGEGKITDFKDVAGRIYIQLEFWCADELWPELMDNVQSIARQIRPESPVMLKLNALRALVEIVYRIERKMSGPGCHADFAEGEAPDEMWRQLALVLYLMSDDDRRKYIDAELVEELDTVIFTKRTRSMYGEKGRDVGDEETEDEDDEDREDGSEEEEEEDDGSGDDE